MTTLSPESTTAPEDFTTDAYVSVWTVATIAAMTRDAAKLEATLAGVDQKGHIAAVQLEQEIDSMILAAADDFAFDTTRVFKVGAQVGALKRYSVTGSTSDLREAFGSSRLVLVVDQEGIEEDATETALDLVA